MVMRGKFFTADEKVRLRRRKRLNRSVLLLGLFALAGALLEPSIISPAGPLATRPERISATFTRCGRGSSMACVVDGDTLRLGQRRIRLIGIDAPELYGASCPAERAAGERATDRLMALVNAGEFDLVGHRFYQRDSHGRDLRLVKRNGDSIGDRLVAEGLARRYYGSRRSWC